MLNPQTHVLTEFEQNNSAYASFKLRALALLIDGLVLAPLALLDWYNKTGWKSSTLLLFSFAVSIAYKPFLEFTRGATFGKQAINILVTDRAGSPITLQQALLRNIFDIAWKILTVIVSLIVFASEGFNDIATNTDYVVFQNAVFNTNPYLIFYTIILLVEIIMVLSNKKRQSLHDRIADTYVVKKGISVSGETL